MDRRILVFIGCRNGWKDPRPNRAELRRNYFQRNSTNFQVRLKDIHFCPEIHSSGVSILNSNAINRSNPKHEYPSFTYNSMRFTGHLLLDRFTKWPNIHVNFRDPLTRLTYSFNVRIRPKTHWYESQTAISDPLLVGFRYSTGASCPMSSAKPCVDSGRHSSWRRALVLSKGNSLLLFGP